MKRILKSIILLLTFSLLTSCRGAEDTATEVTVEMTATVERIFDRIEVNVTESEYTSGIHWVITSDETVFIGKDGEKITREDIAVGDTVRIVYNGQVMMSYPAQIVARKITVL